jgi:phosphotransferase system HPr-like phosphotransfer protein
MSREAHRTITVKHQHGWTTGRTCVCIVRQMRKTDLDAIIRVVKDGKEHKLGSASRLSVLKMIPIHAEEGDELEVLTEGPDAEEALEVFEATAHRCALDFVEMMRRIKEGSARPNSQG